MLTNGGDQTKDQVILHEEHPTKPYQVPVLAALTPLVHLAWSWAPLPFPTKAPFWLCRHPPVPLPIITSRGVKYTHNDISHITLHTDSAGLRLQPIPAESTQEITHTRPDQTHQGGRLYASRMLRVNTVKVRWSSPHDHPERRRLPRYCVRSNIIW